MIRKKYLAQHCIHPLHYLVLAVLMLTCNGKKKQDENLQLAYTLHLKAMDIRDRAADKLAKLKTNPDSLFIKTHKTDLVSISRSLKAWDEQLVEVPGFEETHDHAGHDHKAHDHDHGKQQELTPKQHLEVQQHLLEEIRGIANKINQIEHQP